MKIATWMINEHQYQLKRGALSSNLTNLLFRVLLSAMHMNVTQL